MIRILALASVLALPNLALAELRMSPVFGDSMVVQRDKPIRVWGWSSAGSDVKVEMAGHSANGKSGDP